MLGGNGRGPLNVPVALDALLIGDTISREVTETAMRRSSSSLSRFVEAPVAVSPVPLGAPQTIPVGGAPASVKETVPNLTRGAVIGR
jgi:hypothetical protein